jgi:hypothetical protein
MQGAAAGRRLPGRRPLTALSPPLRPRAADGPGRPPHHRSDGCAPGAALARFHRKRDASIVARNGSEDDMKLIAAGKVDSAPADFTTTVVARANGTCR